MTEKVRGLQITPELEQQTRLLNARISSTNLSHADLLREIENTLNAMVATIAALQKENAELKQKTESSKTQ